MYPLEKWLFFVPERVVFESSSAWNPRTSSSVRARPARERPRWLRTQF